jgi:hypothetical protein
MSWKAALCALKDDLEAVGRVGDGVKNPG